MKPRLYRSVLAASLLAIALVAGGCGKSTSPTNPGGGLDQASADDIALQTGFALNQLDLDVEGGISSIAPTAPVRLRPVPLRALWDTTVTVGGLTIQVTRDFYDAQDQVLPGYGPDAVKLIWTSRIYGSIQTARDTATVGHSASVEFVGIQPADTAITINGAAFDTLLNVFRSYDGTRTRYFYWESALTITNVVMLRNEDQDNWPLSGTAALAVQADRLRSNDRGDVEKHLTATVVVTFNGANQPLVVVNGAYRYRWNMDTGALVRA
jgi:hypothetical protein